MIRFIKLGCAIFVASCTINTPSRNSAIYNCDIIYGHASDWDVISDDLARNIYEHNLKCDD
ncbi:MAG: hypothetical protein II843_02850 [Alphaproteobacteria bacterium]|nr:hypothetical protein [Alphaproteobacteria bacterium]